ncbi:hypothetical protein [Nocardia brevicatena]|uniref:hypothetical protein n=1 Tax=Nocardia brevicatena TaxID=37327 RepID=UPI000594C559|nr:hypothetical protein [Nocardia brevicatena]
MFTDTATSGASTITVVSHQRRCQANQAAPAHSSASTTQVLVASASTSANHGCGSSAVFTGSLTTSSKAVAAPSCGRVSATPTVTAVPTAAVPASPACRGARSGPNPVAGSGCGPLPGEPAPGSPE